MKKQKYKTKAQSLSLLNQRLLTIPMAYRMLGYISLLGVGVIMAYALCPTNNSEVQAATSGAVQVSVKAASNLSVSLGSTVDMQINPGEFASGAATLSVQTNNPTGYAVYMQTKDGSTALTNTTDPTLDQQINSITTEMLGSNFTDNTWGYTLGTSAISETSTFKPIVASHTTAIHSTSSASTSGQTDNYNLGFGAHIDQTLPAGTYSNEVIISVVANPW